MSQAALFDTAVRCATCARPVTVKWRAVTASYRYPWAAGRAWPGDIIDVCAGCAHNFERVQQA